jgi:hypothetical protein
LLKINVPDFRIMRVFKNVLPKYVKVLFTLISIFALSYSVLAQVNKPVGLEHLFISPLTYTTT